MKAWLEPYNLLRLAAIGALLALALMVAAFLLPGPVPLIVFMSAGQGLGTLSLGLYLVVVALDLRRAGVLTPPLPKAEAAAELAAEAAADAEPDSEPERSSPR
jgi:hypothetical protein